jgi:chromosome segregation ATPase
MNDEHREVAEDEMLPVPEDVKPVIEDVKTEPKSPEPTEQPSEEEQEQPKGSKTPETQLYKSLREEREKRKELEQRLEVLEEGSSPKEESAESLQQNILELKLDKFVAQYSALEDKREELNEYIEENSNIPLDKAVNLFRLEKGLIETQPTRKGLEKATAGPKEAPKPKWTPEEIDHMREHEPRKWEKLIDSGVLDDQGW